MKEKLKEKLIPLYKEMLNVTPVDTGLSPFCLQWGQNYVRDNGILFVGKATNGWVTNNLDVIDLFDEENDERIFSRHDQMKWVESLEGSVDIYNTRKSAFWRVVKGISQHVFGNENWSSNIAWSNLYKLAPFEEGNPTETLKSIQLEYCREILKTEIEILNPKIVVFLTSGWENEFLYYLNNRQHTKSIEKIRWNDNLFEIKIYKIGGILFITSQHPQGKPESEHVKVITEIINRYRN